MGILAFVASEERRDVVHTLLSIALAVALTSAVGVADARLAYGAQEIDVGELDWRTLPAERHSDEPTERGQSGSPVVHRFDIARELTGDGRAERLLPDSGLSVLIQRPDAGFEDPVARSAVPDKDYPIRYAMANPAASLSRFISNFRGTSWRDMYGASAIHRLGRDGIGDLALAVDGGFAVRSRRREEPVSRPEPGRSGGHADHAAGERAARLGRT